MRVGITAFYKLTRNKKITKKGRVEKMKIKPFKAISPFKLE